jgi:hypothetical protein
MTIDWPAHDAGPAPRAAGRARPLTEGEMRAAWTVAIMVAALGVLGFVNSFRAVSQAAAASFGRLAPTVPLGIDLAIAVFSAMDLVLARLDMRPRWVRLVPWTLTGATVYLNVAGQHTWFGRIAHAVFPALWVLAVSLAAHVIRIRAQLEAGTGMDRIRPSRWLLAPVSTARLWRRMVLWEIRSYPAALDRERTRLLALTDLQDAYGVLAWRWNAPRRTRALYRLGELAPAGLVRDDPRTDMRLAALGARTPEPAPDARTDNPDHTDGDSGAPLAGEPRTAVVEMIAGQIRDAVEAGEIWRPDYEQLMQLTDRRRSWCEKVVRDARNLVLTPPGSDRDTRTGDPAGEERTDPGPSGLDSSPYAAADRTSDLALTAAP